MSARAINFLLESELIKRAALSRSLSLEERLRRNYPNLAFASLGSRAFKLTPDFVAALKRHGFSFLPGMGSPHNEMFYLSGHSDQRGVNTFESDSWSWKREEINPFLTVYFLLFVSEGRRGVVCMPQIWGNCMGGACHQPTINKLLRVISEHFPDESSMIMEAVNSDNFQPVIFWHDIDLGGIKSVGRLFNEHYGRNRSIVQLVASPLSPFDPSPTTRKYILEVPDRLFVVEEEQPTLIERWEEQLRVFRNSLT